MRVSRTDEGGVTVVEIEGTIKLGESAQLFARELQDVFERTTGGVVIDFARIDYVDSTGIGELVGYLQRFTRANRRVALFRPHHRLEALLKLTRLETIFPIYWEREDALRYVRGDAAR
ncbi:MAG TPA: STAS domain-containing protein [Thermoanaerobaculaceae bacterium]|nr:STAS domain-containing protein [Thermoanaerobaculaceae bacterium]